NGTKQAFTSQDAFTSAGNNFKNVISADVSYVPSGPLIFGPPQDMSSASGDLVNDHGTIFIVQDGEKIGVPDPKTAQSWKLDLSNVPPATASDQALPETGILKVKTPSLTAIADGAIKPTALPKSSLGLSGVTVSNVTDTTATVSWNTTSPAD